MDESELPQHSVTHSNVTPEESWLTVRCRVMILHITVTAEDLRETPFASEYSRLTAKIYNGTDVEEEDYEAFYDWILPPCQSLIRQLVPPIPDSPLSLETFYHPLIESIKITVCRGRLHAQHLPASNSVESINKLKIASHEFRRGFPWFNATDIWIVSASKPHYDHTSDPPSRVQMMDGSTKYFKPGYVAEDIRREMDVYGRVERSGWKGKLRIPNLFGLVVTDEGGTALGLLYDWIPSGRRNLYWPDCRRMKEHHAKWEEQVRETVLQLHKLDIVWECVHPGNIVIDGNLNAWVVDFTGGYVEYNDLDGGWSGAFVRKELVGTKEGDLDSVQTIFEEWLPGGRGKLDGSWVLIPREEAID